MREHRISAQMVRTSTYQWLQQQRHEMVEAVRNGWTVPHRAVMTIRDVQNDGPTSWIQLCTWGPSMDYIDETSGEPVRARPARWYPFDVKMVFTGDRWLVAGAAQGEFPCPEERR